MAHKTRNRQMNDGISSNCDSYLNKLLKRDREVPKNINNILMSKPSFGASNTIRTLRNRERSPPRPNTPNQRSKTSTRPPCVSNIQSDVYTDHSALVEVTVKAKKKAPPNTPVSPMEKERGPWVEILKSSMKKQDSMFNSFDPLRTIHFLSKELRHKLNSIVPDDANIVQMFDDMDIALNRIPPEIAAALKYKKEKTTHKKSKLSLKDEKPEKLIENKVILLDKECQTAPYLIKEETEKIQKLMEDSTIKLESSCRQMEMLCGRLKSEKDELKQQLKNEQDSCKFLKQRVGELEIEKESHKIQLKHHQLEKDCLERELLQIQTERNDMKPVIDHIRVLLNKEEETNLTHKEINAALSKLKQAKDNLDTECVTLRQDLTTIQLEREKYITIVAIRDRQISEIKLEMSQLQQVVSEQLTELNNNALSSMPSAESLTLAASNMFMDKESMNDEKCKSKTDIPEGGSSLEILDNDHNIKNSSHKGNVKLSKSYLNNKNDNIRDLFSQLKKQAYDVMADQDQNNLKRYHSMDTISTTFS